MPHSIYHGVHSITHSDFYYKTPDFNDSRAVMMYWIIDTETGKQFGTSLGYTSDKRVISVMKKSIDGFISATVVHRDELFSLDIVERHARGRLYGFNQAGITVPDSVEETPVFGGPALTVGELVQSA